MPDKVFQDGDYLTPDERERLADTELDMKLQDTLDALTFRQDKELVEMQRRHNHEMRTRPSDLTPQQAADLNDQHVQQYDDLREKHDNERKRYIRENEQAKKILADARDQEKQEALEINKDQDRGISR
jgi:hypothetical protein